MRCTSNHCGFLLVLLALGAVSLAAQEAEDPAPLLDVPVRVEDGDGRPLAGARVRVNWRNHYESDADGRFTIYDVAHSDRLTFAIELTGYQAVRYRELAVSNDGFRFVLEPGIAVRGRVVDEVGEPLAGIEVIYPKHLHNDSIALKPVETDADGRFVLKDASEGMLRLSVMADGVHSESIELQLRTGHDEEVLFVMQPAFDLSGQVTDPQGRPVAGATVQARLDRPGADREPYGYSTSDEDGFFRCAKLLAGTYRVSVVHPELETLHDVVTIADDVDVELRFTARKEPLAIRGRVIDEEGNGVPAVRLTAQSRRNASATTDESGFFELRIPEPGTYFLRVWPPDHPTFRAGKLTLGESAGGPNAVERHLIRIQAGGTVQGRVLGLRPGEADGLVVKAFFAPWQSQDGEVQPDGSYAIHHLPPGPWHVKASLSSPHRSVTKQVTIHSAEDVVELDLVPVAVASSRLSGLVRLDGEPLGNALIRVSCESTGMGPPSTRTGPDGHFTLPGLRPAPDCAVHAERGRTIHGQQDVDLTASREVVLDLYSSLVSGVVLDAASREPLSGVEVSLLHGRPLRTPLDRMLVTEKSDADGRFAFHVTQSRWRLAARLDGHGLSEQLIEVLGPQHEETLLLREAEPVILDVVDADGGLPGGVWVTATRGAPPLLREVAYRVDHTGRIVLRTLTPGRYTVSIRDEHGHTSGGVEIEVPGEPVRVQLR